MVEGQTKEAELMIEVEERMREVKKVGLIKGEEEEVKMKEVEQRREEEDQMKEEMRVGLMQVVGVGPLPRVV